MNRLLTLLVVFTFGLSSLHAQGRMDNTLELGFRISSSEDHAVSLDAIIPFASNSVHANLFLGDGLGTALVYDLKLHLIEGFYGYLGGGGGTNIGDEFSLVILGEIGFGYAFYELPLSLSLDYRPQIDLINGDDFDIAGVGFNIRYRF